MLAPNYTQQLPAPRNNSRLMIWGNCKYLNNTHLAPSYYKSCERRKSPLLSCATIGFKTWTIESICVLCLIAWYLTVLDAPITGVVFHLHPIVKVGWLFFNFGHFKSLFCPIPKNSIKVHMHCWHILGNFPYIYIYRYILLKKQGVKEFQGILQFSPIPKQVG